MTFTYKIPCFDLEQTAGSGQVFRMIPAPGRTNTWQVISQGHVCFIRQENDIFFLECGPDLENFWKNYFDLNTDYEKMIASITPDDHYLKAASKAGQGIRILRQDTWEMHKAGQSLSHTGCRGLPPTPGSQGSSFAVRSQK